MAKKTTKQSTKPKITKSAAADQLVERRPRRLKSASYKSFRLHKRIKHPVIVPSSFKIMRKGLQTLTANWKLFLGITIIYGLLTVILVRGVGGGLDLTHLKQTFKSGVSGGHYSNLAAGATLFSYLLGSAGSSNSPTGGLYETMLIIIMSLVTVWALRQVLAGKRIRIRDALYKGTYPLIPFILVLLVVALELLPLALGSWLYSTVVSNAIAVTALERILWALLYFLLALLSLYMLCSSLFALYIVTLPDMAPLRALRSAREIVRHRRFTVLRKILFLPLVLLIIGALIIIPLIIWLTPAAQWAFFLLTMFVLVIVHSYMYTLYRELL